MPSETRDVGVVVLGHGSRDARANDELESLVASYRDARPDFVVGHAYVELAQPSVADALDTMAVRARRVVVAPLFLFAAGHVKNDLPIALAAARTRWPETRFEAASHLGVHPALAEMAFDRVAESLAKGGAPAEKTAVIVVGRGSSDPDANGDFCKMARLVGEGRGFARVEPTFMGITSPRVAETLELVSRARPDRIVLLPYLLFAGRLVERLEADARAFAERQPWIRIDVAPHLGVDRRLFDLLDTRVNGALNGEGLLPCDTCIYKTATPGFAQQVGGLKAMLYSVRHLLTHAQAAPHVHAHRPVDKHVLVCTNTDCADRGGHELVTALRSEIRNACDVKVARTLRVTKTSCMGRCGEGPTLVVYPDGVWYRGVKPADASEIVNEHLLGDKLVGRLVDSIMQ